MAINQDQIAITLKELMTSIVTAKEAGFPCDKPGSVKFTFPVDGTTGAFVEFEVRMDWYAGADEKVLWPTTTEVKP
jgi:hypothetical protein